MAAEEAVRQRELRRQERRKKAHDTVLAVERRKVRRPLAAGLGPHCASDGSARITQWLTRGPS